MSDAISITLAGEPRGKGRPRFVRASGRTFTPPETRSYEAALRYAAQDVMAERTLLDGPLKVAVWAFLGIPASWSRKRSAAALAGREAPTKKPDADNLIKTLDALNGVVWRDDAQIVTAFIEKRWSDRPRLVVNVAPWVPA